MSHHGEEKITPKRRKRRRCIAEESSASNSDWGSAHPDRDPESDRGAKGAGAQNGFPRQPRHHPGPHPAVPRDQRWHRDVRDGPYWSRRGSGEVPFVCGVRWRRLVRGFVWRRQQWRRRPDMWSLSVCRHHIQLGLWHPTALQHRQVAVWLRLFCFRGPESSLLMWLVQVKTYRQKPSHTWF